MSLKKILLTLSLAATFSLVACGDDSSSPTDSGRNTPSSPKGDKSGKGGDAASCKFTSDETSFSMKATGAGEEGTVDGILKGGVFTMTSVGPADDESCTDLEEGESCTVKDGVETSVLTVEEGADITFGMYKNIMKSSCDAINSGAITNNTNDNGNAGEEDGDGCDEQCMQELEKALDEMFGEGMEFEE